MKKPFLTIMCALAVPGLIAACSNEESPTHAFRLREENGVMIAETTGGPKFTGELFEYEELYQLEQDESREETLLSEARFARMDEEGYVYVTDGGNNRIAVFGPDGSFSHSIGREGSGPGEFRSPSLLGFDGDMVVVINNMLQRTLLFRRDGTFIRSFEYPRMNMLERVFYNTRSAWPAPGGGSVLIQQGMGMTETGQSITFRAAVLSPDGELLTDLRAPQSQVPRNYEGLPMMHYFPGVGLGRSLPEEPVLELFGLDGTLRKKIRIEYEPEPVTQGDREQVRDAMRQYLESIEDGRQREIYQQRLDDLSFPSSKSFWFSAVLGTDGFFWASVPGYRLSLTASGSRYRVLSPKGEYLGVTSFPDVPASVSRAQLDHGHLIFMYEDEATGAPIITVFRLHSAIRGFTYP
jgi:hypothetical protein